MYYFVITRRQRFADEVIQLVLQKIYKICNRMDCFAPLAMTGGKCFNRWKYLPPLAMTGESKYTNVIASPTGRGNPGVNKNVIARLVRAVAIQRGVNIT